MGWDGSGNVVRTDGSRTGASVWDQAKGAGIKIVSGGHDHHDEDLASSIENTVARDGQNSPTSNLPMGGRKHTGVPNATEPQTTPHGDRCSRSESRLSWRLTWEGRQTPSR